MPCLIIGTLKLIIGKTENRGQSFYVPEIVTVPRFLCGRPLSCCVQTRLGGPRPSRPVGADGIRPFPRPLDVAQPSPVERSCLPAKVSDVPRRAGIEFVLFPFAPFSPRALFTPFGVPPAKAGFHKPRRGVSVWPGVSTPGTRPPTPLQVPKGRQNPASRLVRATCMSPFPAVPFCLHHFVTTIVTQSQHGPILDSRLSIPLV